MIAFTPKVLRIGDSEIIGKEIVTIKFLNFTENVDRSNFQKFACFWTVEKEEICNLPEKSINLILLESLFIIYLCFYQRLQRKTINWCCIIKYWKLRDQISLWLRVYIIVLVLFLFLIILLVFIVRVLLCNCINTKKTDFYNIPNIILQRFEPKIVNFVLIKLSTNIGILLHNITSFVFVCI